MLEDLSYMEGEVTSQLFILLLYFLLGLVPRTICMLGKHHASELHPSPGWALMWDIFGKAKQRWWPRMFFLKLTVDEGLTMKTAGIGAGRVAHGVELPSMLESLSLILSTAWSWIGWCTSVIPEQEMEPEGSWGHGHLQLYMEFEASLGYSKPCLKDKTNK